MIENEFLPVRERLQDLTGATQIKRVAVVFGAYSAILAKEVTDEMDYAEDRRGVGRYGDQHVRVRRAPREVRKVGQRPGVEPSLTDPPSETAASSDRRILGRRFRRRPLLSF